MKKEFGKWLMDIAKYMVTALLLSTIFADMAEPIILWMVVIFSAEVTGGQARCDPRQCSGEGHPIRFNGCWQSLPGYPQIT